MNGHFGATVVVGLVAASPIDWRSAGVQFHDRYMRHPEEWQAPGNDTRGIVAAQVLTVPAVLGLLTLIELLAVAAGAVLL